MKQKVYIIVLNYNNWADTIACAESILANDYTNYQLIIVDNDSPDDSMTYIRQWAEGALESWTPPSDPLRRCTFPPQRKPVDHIFHEEDESLEQACLHDHRVVLIQSRKNGGYSAGNNVGIRYAKARGDFDYLWILNNDTVIEKDALVKLVDFANRHEPRIGLIGTTLLFYDAPDKIQAFGAAFNRFIAVQKHYLSHETYSEKIVQEFDQKKLDYIIGASMLMTRRCIDKIGVMPEEYFIYFEEIDIATNCRRNGFDFAICTEAVVYHKESVAIKQENQSRSAFSDFYAMRNRVIVTQKYHTHLLPFVYGGLFLSMLLRLKRGDFESVKNIVRIMKTPPSKIQALEFTS